LVFQYTAWQSEYNPTGTLGIVIGLKLLISVFPIIAAIFAFGLIYLYKLQGEKPEQIESRINKENV
jgi:Na+/melibiose symporter-like transporter